MKKTTVIALAITITLSLLSLIFLLQRDCERQEFLKRELTSATNMGFADSIKGWKKEGYLFKCGSIYALGPNTITELEDISYRSKFYPDDLLYDGVIELKKIHPKARVTGFEFIYSEINNETDPVEAQDGTINKVPRKVLTGILFHYD